MGDVADESDCALVIDGEVVDVSAGGGLDTVTTIHVLAQVEREVEAEVRERNAMSEGQKARDAIRSMRGVVGRVTDGILKVKAEIDAAEREAIGLAGSAKVAQLKELDGIKGELSAIINDLKDISNGPPEGPLPGAERSENSGPPSGAENPMGPQR